MSEHPDYCPSVLNAAPAHQCLCTHEHAHSGAHLCLCGHTWHTSWTALSYDQQRALCGLPEVPGSVRAAAAMRRVATLLAGAAGPLGAAMRDVATTANAAARTLRDVLGGVA